MELDTPVTGVFTVHTANCLCREGIRTIGDVIRYSAGELTEIRNFGGGRLAEVQARLAAAGLELNPDGTPERREEARRRDSEAAAAWAAEHPGWPAGWRRLRPREAAFLAMRRGLHDGAGPLTLAQIGRLSGLTPERVRQVVKQAEAKLAEAEP